MRNSFSLARSLYDLHNFAQLGLSLKISYVQTHADLQKDEMRKKGNFGDSLHLQVNIVSYM